MRRGSSAAPVTGALSFVAGLVHTAAFAPGDAAFEGWIQILALAGLAALVTRARSARAALRDGWLFGLGWFVSGVAWVYVSMHQYGGMPAPLAALATVGFAAYLALFPGFACAVAAHLGQRRGALAQVPAFAAAFTLAELARGYLLTGFPWIGIGYAHTDTPLAGFAPLGGVHASGLAAAAVAALLACGLAPRMRATSRAAAALALVIIVAAGSALTGVRWVRPSGGPLSVRLIQGNVPQELKFRPERAARTMARYTELVESGQAQLTVLPETAWVVPWEATPAPLRARLQRHASASDGWIAIGMPLRGERHGMPRPTNSVGVLGPEGAASAALVARYDKRHLVPFGEFVPLGFRWFVDLMQIPLGDFGRGATRQPPVPVADQRIAFNICYEDIFGEELIAAIRDDGATVLVNVSNLAWFGATDALDQHLQIARMRAIETGRPMLRATNTGMTAVIEGGGRVAAVLAPRIEGVLEASVTGTLGLTPFVRGGNLPVALLAGAVLGAAAWRNRRLPGPNEAVQQGDAAQSR